MPLTRCQIRNEYSLADPELFKAADKDDPEALLEGVAMAGLVGVLRQLGDLAEFAAEIFHDLHEEVMTTAARGHGLMARVQQLEAEFPSIEKAFLSQTNHSPFFSSSGADWHPNLQMEQNLITRGGLPRFVMDSYEECRGPPQLFHLDKFDVAGAGACLKRYTDPSFFKVEAASSGIATVEVQRGKKIRKKKGSRYKNGETPEVVPASHAKLHELFLEERSENGHSDPARLVKLKRRLFNESPFDLKPGKSYMQKFVLTPSPDRKQVCEDSVTHSPLKLTLDNYSESGYEIHEVSVASPVKQSSHGGESTSSSPSEREAMLKTFMDELNGEPVDSRIIKVLNPIVDREMDEYPLIAHKMVIEEESSVDADGKAGGTVDGDHSDDMTSEVENYMDALTTMDSGMETDNEYKPMNGQDFMDVRAHSADSDANKEQLDAQANFSDSQSIGNSSLSEGGNSSFKKGTCSFSYSDTLSNVAENTASDGEGAGEWFPSISSTENYPRDIADLPSDSPSVFVESGITESHHLVTFNDTEEDKIPDSGEASRSSCLTDWNLVFLHAAPVAGSMVSPLAGPELDEASSGSMKPGSESPNSDRNGLNLADSLVALSDFPSQSGHDTSLPDSSKTHSVCELDHKDPKMLTNAVVLVSNMSDLAFEKKGSVDSVNGVLQTDYAAEHSTMTPAEERFPKSTLPVVELDSGVLSLPDNLDVVKPDVLVSEVDDAIATRETRAENLTLVVDTSETECVSEHHFSDITIDASQLELDSSKLGVPCSEVNINLEEISNGFDAEENDAFTKVDITRGDAASASFEHQSLSSDKPVLEDRVNLDDAVTETGQAEDMAVSTSASGGANNVSNVICPYSELVCSPPRNATEPLEALSIPEDPHLTRLDLDEVISAKPLSESQVQMEVTSIDWDSNPYKPVSEDHPNQEVSEVHNPSLELSNQESETKDNHQHHYAEASNNTVCLPLCYLPESGNTLEQSTEVQDDQISAGSSHADNTNTLLSSQTSSTGYLVGTESPLEHAVELQSDQPDRGCLKLGEASSISTDLQSESSCLKDLSSQELLLQSFCQERNATVLETNPFDSAFPSFGVLPVPEASQVYPEAMPPLPPLPPMQWRLGKIQPASLDADRDMIDNSEGTFPLIQPFMVDQQVQFYFPSLDREIVHPSNPFLSLPVEESRMFPHSTTESMGNSLLPTPLLSETLIIDNDAHYQQDHLRSDTTQSVSSSLALPEMSNERHEHGFLPLGGESAQFSSNPFSLEPNIEHMTAVNDPMPTQGLPIHPFNQSAPKTGLDMKFPGQSSQSSEEELGNSSGKSAAPLTMEEEPHHDFVTSQGLTMWPPTALAMTPPTYEVGKPNGNKIPRPRNPLIDAVAAHDKSKLRKVAELVRPQVGPKVEERDSLLEQIRTKSFNLKPATVTRPSIQGIQGPKTNLKVAAILEKANAIRQALTGSDEDNDSDSWSDS
ncbi:PREDICTED: protein SCAR2 isoform X2 [Populus euphratica]|uniref:Protein SCAR n=1 Tax=Populus euphratica TaxID=75702 RepID=A0AAJ6XHD4_POPEU|nr:PREDICTED: protein SCAR2 isoform X2 [Populus euphratica]